MKKILIVDDDLDLLELVKYMLGSRGFEAHTHAFGAGVEGVVNEVRPDLILMDIRLPGASGAELCKQLKLTHNVCIFLFSADPFAGKEFPNFYADGFIEKPFDVPNFINTITSACYERVAISDIHPPAVVT